MMMQTFKVKSLAFLSHLLISVIVILIFLMLIKLLWYPDALFELENVWQGLQILIIVDATLGPCLTFVAFKPNKKNLKFDLIAIGVMQLLALVYGAMLIHQQRPAIIVYVVDRFEILNAAEAVVEDLVNSPNQTYAGGFPILSHARTPVSAEERSHFITSSVKFHHLAERHSAIDSHLDEIRENALDLDLFQPKSAQSIQSLNNFKQQYNPQDYLLLPLQGTNKNGIVIAISTADLTAFKLINIDPWNEYQKPISAYPKTNKPPP